MNSSARVKKAPRLFGTMDSSSSKPSRPGPRVTAPRRPLTNAARRDIRRHVALAAEMKCYSVEVNGVVWTLHHSLLFNNMEPGLQRGSHTFQNQVATRASGSGIKSYGDLSASELSR